ncbi:MAG: thioredoxin family protein [Bacteroidaceae bacterium]|nr:thioredoxin family protein [Bacteroidaceae bacterium]
MKKLIFTMIACLALTAQAKVIKRIKSPESLLCLNVYRGELKANEVVMTDTATTIKFSLTFPKGDYFCIAQWAALIDEDGNRYPVHSIEGMKFGEWITVPDSGVKDFTLHFAPMPKHVKIFDFIEGDGDNMFMLLGIHDSKTELHFPTLKEVSEAHAYAFPADWFKTDTITIKGRIEGYDAKDFGCNAMRLTNSDVFGEYNHTMNVDINADGTFEKKFQYSMPFLDRTFTESKNGFNGFKFFALPGETIDVTIRRNSGGGFDCIYNNGSSKDVNRLLKSTAISNSISEICTFEGNIADFNVYAERIWNNTLYCLAKQIRNGKYTPLETQLALAKLQSDFTEGVINYFMYHESVVQKEEIRDGVLYREIIDSTEYAAMYDKKSYVMLKKVDFNNPLFLCFGSSTYFIVNSFSYNHYYREKADSKEKDIIENKYAALRDLLGNGNGNTLFAQVCLFDRYKSYFKHWKSSDDFVKKSSMEIGKDFIENNCISSIHPLYLSAITHPYIHAKLEQFYANKMAAKDLTWALPKNNAAADVIRSIAARYPGRYLYIDFWGMGCGPCRGEIQQYKDKRAEIAKRDDVKLVFIAGERTEEGSEGYRKYVKEWLDGEEAVCVTNEMFNIFTELFRFSAIPHKEIITPDGRVVSDDISVNMYDFDRSFEAMKEKVEK